ncbi:hypothetical protein [Calidithermus roseus]|uniref:DUF4388 domain-containing protein n=1 Tax=Calidithermus roseus TaxID=1644118 RepID=A0A399ETW9_9DEIN|nr:hypothetical protein [Calidithermus roseus]RIH86052.1 hypothetical protein Mrose_01939 [Calidithermus roseus]
METTTRSNVPYVFRLLARAHPAEKLSGGAFEQAMAILQGSEFSGLMTLETRTGLLARILFQRGRLVHALRGEVEGARALEQLRAEPGFNAIALHPLEGPALALALAAVFGEARSLGHSTVVNVPVLLEQLRREGFSGVVALELGLNLKVWVLKEGEVLEGSEVLEGEQRGRLTELLWPGAPIPELGAVEPAAPARAVETPPEALNLVSAGELEALDPERIWQAAQEVINSRFGSRAAGVMERFRRDYGGLEPAQLLQSLSAQIENVLGSYYAERFREMATLAERSVAENVEGR